jgi:hypothetical protein
MAHIGFSDQACVLELHYLKLLDPLGGMVKGKTVFAGTELTLEVKYRQSGFPKVAVTTLGVELFDASGESLIHEDSSRPFVEGTRLDRYRFTVPEKISGKFLAVLTIKVLNKDEVLSEVMKTAPFDVKEAEML